MSERSLSIDLDILETKAEQCLTDDGKIIQSKMRIVKDILISLQGGSLSSFAAELERSHEDLWKLKRIINPQ